MEAGKERLTRDSVRDATQHEVGQLKRENGELKELVADEAYRLKKTVIPMPQDCSGGLPPRGHSQRGCYLCRREGIKPHSYYSWTKEFMEAGKERLTRDSVRDATQHEVGQLKRENGELKELVADLSLEAYRLKKRSSPCPRHAAAPGSGT